jgi:Gram-negative bacterial TonB protein C-terminal
MNIRPLVENLYAAPPVGRLPGAPEGNSARLLELRTKSGLLYLCPSGWQRLRLLWTFRHFHILPPQLLSRRDQRLIESLSRSAVVTPALPVPRSTVFGVVENVPTKSDSATVVLFEEPAGPAVQDKPIQDRAVQDSPVQDRPVEVAREFRFLQRWGALGAVIALCLLLILARVSITRSPAVSRPAVQAAAHVAVRVPSPIPPAAEKAELPVLPPEPTPVARKSAPASHLPKPVIESSPAAPPAELATVAPPAVVAPSDGSQRPLISDLPQGHMVQPVLSDPSLVGQLDLRALIGADGSVKEVTLVSGNPKLAEAGIRAVRRWQYAPSQAAGLNGEAETLIRMNFFGQDAVSITSVAR